MRPAAGLDKGAPPEAAPQHALPRIETGRLILRVPSLDDLDRWAEMHADADAVRFIGGAQPRSIVWRTIMQTIGAWHATGISMFSVIEKERGRWIGRVGPWCPLDWPGTEVEWGLHRDAWGNGYALEAARAAIDYAFDTLGWTEVVHCIDPENTRSQALARRLGARVLRQDRMPAPFDANVIDVWGQTRAEWTARQGHDARSPGPRSRST